MKKTLFCVAGLLCVAEPTLAAQKAHAVAHMKALDGSAVGTIDFNENLLVQVFSQYPGKILQAFHNIFVAYSDDHGQTWTPQLAFDA